jgi:transposase
MDEVEQAGLAVRQVRQYRSREERRRIVEETLAGGVSVAVVARRHGINANQAFQWRRLYRDGRLGAPPQSGMDNVRHFSHI